MFDNRLLRVRFLFPDKEGSETKFIEYQEDMNVKVSVSKTLLSLQNTASVEISGLRPEFRAQLMSSFNQFKVRKMKSDFLPVQIFAGRESYGVSKIFEGASILCDMTPPPDITVKGTFGTSQLDKTKWNFPNPPANLTYKQLCEWAASEAVLNRHLIFDVSEKYANAKVTNFNPGQRVVAEAIPILIQRYYPDQVAAYIDDKTFVVRDINKIIEQNGIVEVGHGTAFPFIEIPKWTEYGIEGKVLFCPEMKLGSGVRVTSIMNPTVNGEYVVGRLEYELTSRDSAFYCTFHAYPPGASK